MPAPSLARERGQVRKAQVEDGGFREQLLLAPEVADDQSRVGLRGSGNRANRRELVAITAEQQSRRSENAGLCGRRTALQLSGGHAEI